jgi:ABC-type transport system involved in multi-copper enzyme maturation permease subunit
MRDLLKADLKRALKDKLFLVLCILAGVFAISTPLLYKAIFSVLDMEELFEMGELLRNQFTAKGMFFTSFSPSNNFGMILPILVAIILCKDFSHGTIRNKIICGKSRTKIYFSLFCTCAILMICFILAQALVTLLISLTMFEYQADPFTANDFGYLMASIAFEFVVYLFISALLTFFVVSMKNAGTAIVMYFAVNFVLLIVGSITQTALLLSDSTSSSYEVLKFFNDANMFTSLLIGGGASYTGKEVLTILLPNIFLIAVFVFFGWYIFRKKDLK